MPIALQPICSSQFHAAGTCLPAVQPIVAVDDLLIAGAASLNFRLVRIFGGFKLKRRGIRQFSLWHKLCPCTSRLRESRLVRRTHTSQRLTAWGKSPQGAVRPSDAQGYNPVQRFNNTDARHADLSEFFSILPRPYHYRKGSSLRQSNRSRNYSVTGRSDPSS